MSTKVRKKTDEKSRIRLKNRKKIRSKVTGTAERPRMSVFRSNQHLYVQIVDDAASKTLVSVSSVEEEFRGKVSKNLEGAKAVGGMVAKRALAKNIAKITFDRSGYLYHGRIKALADAAREGGLQF